MAIETIIQQVTELDTQYQVLLVLGALVVVAFVYSQVTKDRAPKGLRLPPRWSKGLPIVGTFIEFAKNPVDCVMRAYRESGHHVFTMRLVTEDCTFMVGPEAHSYFFSASDEELDQAEVYQFMTPVFGKGVVFDAPQHLRRQQLRGLASALKPSELRKYPEVIAKETRDFLNAKWGDSGEIDLLPSMADLIILTASATLLGPEVRNEMFAEVSHLYEMLDKGLAPLSVFLPHAPTQAHARRDEAREEISKLFGRVVKQRKDEEEAGSKKKYNDLLDKLIKFRYNNGDALTVDEITGMLIAALFAGQHTSSITTTWTTTLLLDAHKRGVNNYLQEVLDEIAEVEAYPGAFANGEVSSAEISKEDKMYNAMKEALRMYPPLIILMRRVKVPITMADGTYIPVGHRAMVSNAVAQMLPEIFPEPEKYDPARWDAFDITKLPKYSFIGFGAGLHTCMGEPFAFMQVRTILSVMLSMYDLELVTGTPKPNYNAMVVPPTGPNIIRYKRRTYSESDVAKAKEARAARAKLQPEKKIVSQVESDVLNADSATYTMEEVKKHDNKDDLWIVVDGKVYDVTNYVDIHQGGENALVRWAGKDASVPVAGPQHPSTVKTLLERYRIGTLVE